MYILIHSSKTMRAHSIPHEQTTVPELLPMAVELTKFVKTLDVSALSKVMHISNALAERTYIQMRLWDAKSDDQCPAVTSFIGDIYSGLGASDFSAEEKAYATKHLRILSGLYGILRPYDAIQPYRLEMGYSLSNSTYKNLYQYWGDAVSKTLEPSQFLINVSSVEYMKAVLPYADPRRIVTPQFLSINSKTGVPVFTAVHAKIARGAFARWLIKNRFQDITRFSEFNELGYSYDPQRSNPAMPTYVCKEFGGKGLSVRLQKIIN
jgi:cytoplasmic iron level regulating protein YaaA (DUF328/UPF0246 family)